jgi:hypothetical protein
MTETKPKQLFDFINGIYLDQSKDFFDNLTDGEKKTYKYSKYMIHRFLSMNPHFIPIVNTLQKYTQIPERAHYLFLTGLIPRGKQFNKYIKSKKEDKYEKWMVELVSKHYNISIDEAIQYIEIYYKSDKEGLKLLCQRYGIDQKQLKKAKL